MNSEQWTANSGLLIANSGLFTVHCSLFTIHYSLSVDRKNLEQWIPGKNQKIFIFWFFPEWQLFGRLRYPERIAFLTGKPGSCKIFDLLSMFFLKACYPAKAILTIMEAMDSCFRRNDRRLSGTFPSLRMISLICWFL